MVSRVEDTKTGQFSDVEDEEIEEEKREGKPIGEENIPMTHVERQHLIAAEVPKKNVQIEGKL